MVVVVVVVVWSVVHSQAAGRRAGGRRSPGSKSQWPQTCSVSDRRWTGVDVSPSAQHSQTCQYRETREETVSKYWHQDESLGRHHQSRGETEPESGPPAADVPTSDRWEQSPAVRLTMEHKTPSNDSSDLTGQKYNLFTFDWFILADLISPVSPGPANSIYTEEKPQQLYLSSLSLSL